MPLQIKLLSLNILMNCLSIPTPTSPTTSQKRLYGKWGGKKFQTFEVKNTCISEQNLFRLALKYCNFNKMSKSNYWQKNFWLGNQSDSYFR